MSSKTQAGRRWYEANAETDATGAWKAWEELSRSSKARYARAEKAFMAKLYDAGYLIMTKASADSIEKASGKKSTVLTDEDINTFTDAETELEAIKQFLDGVSPGKGTVVERVIGIRGDLAEMNDRCKRAEEALARVVEELGALGIDGIRMPNLTPQNASEMVNKLVKERIHLMREASRLDCARVTQKDRAKVLERVILKAMRGEKA